MKYLWETHLSVEERDSEADHHDKARSEILPLVQESPGRILDVGYAIGATGRMLKSLYPDCTGIGIELNARAAESACSVYERVIQGTLADPGFLATHLEPGSIDTVLLLDVLERAYNPWKILVNLKPYLSGRGRLIISLPNVFNIQLIEQLASGRWPYDKRGVLDITHIRFFAPRDMLDMLDQTGYAILQNHGVPHHTGIPFTGIKQLMDGAETEHAILRNLSPQQVEELFSVQRLILATPKEKLRKDEKPALASSVKDVPAPAAPASRNQPCPCGSGKRYKNCCGDIINAQVPPPQPIPSQATDLQGLMHSALDFQRKNELAAAKALYRQALEIRPDLPDALHMLGVIAYMEYDLETAESLILRAQALLPRSDPAMQRNLALVRGSQTNQQALQPFCARALARMENRLAPFPANTSPTPGEAIAGLGIIADLTRPAIVRDIQIITREFSSLGLPAPKVWHAGPETPPTGWDSTSIPSGDTGNLPKERSLLFLGLDVGITDWLENTPRETTLLLYCPEADTCRLLDAIEAISQYGRRRLSLIYRNQALAASMSLPGAVLPSPEELAVTPQATQSSLRELVRLLARL